jgi:hypothetical protein
MGDFEMTVVKPLVLDVDGRSLDRHAVRDLGRTPAAAIATLGGARTSATRAPEELARIALIPNLLPVNPEVADLALRADDRTRGRAARPHRSLVTRLAADYGLLDRVFASDATVNLKDRLPRPCRGPGERLRLRRRQRRRAVWERAENAIVVGRARRELAARVGRTWWNSAVLERHSSRRCVRQWVKNVLLFLAMIAHRFDRHNVRSSGDRRLFGGGFVDLHRQRPLDLGRTSPTHEMPPPLRPRRRSDHRRHGEFRGAMVLALGIAAALNLQFFGVVALWSPLAISKAEADALDHISALAASTRSASSRAAARRSRSTC